MKRQIELYVREGNGNTGDYARVDLFDFEDINYTTRVSDIRNIAKVLTDFTHSFTIPASKNNNLIFKHYENFTIINGFDGRYKRDAIIKINGVDYRRGQISLNKTNSQKGSLYSYSLTFYGKVVSLNQLFGNDELESLYGVGTCLDDFNHELDGDYVSKGLGEGYQYDESGNSLDRAFSSLNFDYCFPFISADDYHYYDSSDGPSPKDGSNLSRNIHPSSTYNASIEQYTGVRAFALKPAIKAKWIIKAIEQKYDIQFSNHFFNNGSNDEFDELFLWLNREKGRIDEQVGETTTQFGLDDFTYVSSTPSSLGDVVVNTNQLAPNGSSVGDYRYSIDFTITPSNNDGLYSWSAKDALTNNGFGGNNDVTGTQTVTCIYENNGNVAPQIEIRTNGGITSATFSNLEIRRERFEYDGNTGGGFAYQWEPAGVVSYTFDNPTVIFSEGINIGRNLPKMKITEFLQTLFKMFNLTAYFEYTSDEIHVDTMDSFYEDGGVFDISDMIDYKKSETQKALLYNEIKFEYKGDKTFAKRASDDITNDDFGDEVVDHNSTAVDSPLAFDGNKDYKVKLPLEKMMYERMTDQADETVVTDIQWGWMANDNAQPIKGQPMFFYAEKLSGATQIKFSLVDGGSSVNKTQYIVPSNCLDLLDSTTQSLHWGSEFNEYDGVELTESLFKTYYQKYISDIYNVQTRLVKLTAILDTNLILNLRPNDSLVINNRSYRINKWETNLTTGKTEFELMNNINNTIITTGSTSGGGSDTTSPTMAITSSTTTSGSSGTNSTLAMVFTSSESTTNFAIGDITVTNGVMSSFSGSGTTYNATFTPSGNGLCTISVGASSFTDNAGNNNNVSNTFNFTKTTANATGPTQSITSFSVSDGGSTASSSVVITMTPSEVVNPLTFTLSDIGVTNGVASNLSNPIGNLWSYTITPSGNGVVTTSIAANRWTGSVSGDGCQASNTFTFTKI